MQPRLALSYSSRNAIRGGLAAGWTLSIPRIEVDTSQGRLEGTFYRSTLSGTRLLRVTGAVANDTEAFRAEFDNTYARYERVIDGDGQRECGGYEPAMAASGRSERRQNLRIHHRPLQLCQPREADGSFHG